MAGESAQKIGRYEVVGKLTTGGMAEIFLGRLTGPRGFEKPVVIKRILPHLSSPTFSEMFLDEARIAADIRHPNVVQVFDFGEEGGLHMAMEYLEGESVGGILRRLWTTGRTLPPAAAALIAAAACAGLHAAHELVDRQGRALRLVHRDVSPSNLFVTYDGHVKVLDFGVAKAHGTEAQRTDTGQVRGKSAYMSPEQSLARSVDRRSDLFSLGIVLFEMTTMRRLFQRENPLLTYKALCEEPIPSMSDVMPDAPKELERIARRALERSPDARYANAQEMRHELLAAARKLTTAEPEELLAETMHDLFAERISEKNALRSGLETGKELDHLPEAETDLGATIPSIGREAAARGTATGESKRSRALAVGLVLSAVGGLGVLAVRASRGNAPRPSVEAAASPAPVPAPVPDPRPSAAPPASPPAAGSATAPLPAGKPRARPAERRPHALTVPPSAPTAPPSARESGPDFHRFD